MISMMGVAGLATRGGVNLFKNFLKALDVPVGFGFVFVKCQSMMSEVARVGDGCVAAFLCRVHDSGKCLVHSSRGHVVRWNYSGGTEICLLL
jgi:hypothetical protein